MRVIQHKSNKQRKDLPLVRRLQLLRVHVESSVQFSTTMSQLTLSKISEILDARLNDNHGLEFNVRLAGENGTTWIEQDRIAAQTLNCKKFRTFYQTKDQSIQTATGLIQHLKQQMQANEFHNNINDENISQSSCESMVKVKLGSKTLSYSIDRLRSLSYFKALLSDRWLKNRDLQETTIDILSENRNLNNNNGEFNFTHLDWLLKCALLETIPHDMPAELGILEGLINCDDYLMDKQDSIVNVDSLADFLSNMRPRFTRDDHQRLLSNTNNDILKKALNIFNQQMESKINQMRLELIDNHASIVGMRDIVFDNKTAFLLLKEKLKIILEKNGNNDSSIRIRIKDFNSNRKQDYMHLI